MENSCMKQVESHWQTLTASANLSFDQGDFERALPRYKDAHYRAEVLNGHIGDCMRLKIPFIQVFLISCNNLAYTYEALQRYEEGETMLKRSIHYLFHLLQSGYIRFNEIQSDLKGAIATYVDYVRKLEDGDEKQEQFISMLNGQLEEHDITGKEQ